MPNSSIVQDNLAYGDGQIKKIKGSQLKKYDIISSDKLYGFNIISML